MCSKDTWCVSSNRQSEGVNTPVYNATAYRYLGNEEIIYPRNFNTVNQKLIVDKLCVLEQGEAGLIFSSGTAAIATTLFSLLKAGDHIILSREIYGGTIKLVKEEFPKYNIAFDFISSDEMIYLETKLRKNTKIVYTETPSNPFLSVVDLKAIAAVAKKHQLVSIVDNTFASPIIQNPIALGIDVVLHSGTKYLGGHHDLCFGALITSKELKQRIYPGALNFGGSVNGMDCFLIERSLKTLAVRVEKQNANAMKVATALKGNPDIAKVYYPGLPDHPDYELALKQMKGGFGALLSFELTEPSKTEAFLNKLKVIIPALSLGGVETTICQPATSSHASLSANERKAQGISDALLRLSVGVENWRDLLEDVSLALNDSV